MTDSPQTPPIMDPTPDSSTENDPDMSKPIESRGSIADKLSYFSEYIDQYPNRIPLASVRKYGVLVIMIFGSIAGVVLVRQNLDNRQQASEGNKQVPVCEIRDTAKLSIKKIDNSKACLLNGKTYFTCEDSYTFTDNECVYDSN